MVQAALRHSCQCVPIRQDQRGHQQLTWSDIKPSNILANTAGQIKICDFGVSGELINSIANTFVGTSTYMSVCPLYILSYGDIHLIDHTCCSHADLQPERIQGAAYTIKSDIWSLGISLIEIATGRFPFQDGDDSSDDDGNDDEGEYDPDPTLPISSQRPNLAELQRRNRNLKRKKGVSLGGDGHTMSILDLLQHIVNEPAPELKGKRKNFPVEAQEFVRGCLIKAPGDRMSPQDLLVSLLPGGCYKDGSGARPRSAPVSEGTIVPSAGSGDCLFV